MADEETKKLIRSCLISTKGSLSLRELKRDFQTLVGYAIPFRDNGFRSLEDYLRSIPDVVRLNESGPEPLVHFVADASTAGIASLVQRQKPTKKKAPPRRPVAYVPRPSYGAVRRTDGFSAPRFDFQPRRAYNVRPNSAPRQGLLPTPGPRWAQPAAFRPAGQPPRTQSARPQPTTKPQPQPQPQQPRSRPQPEPKAPTQPQTQPQRPPQPQTPKQELQAYIRHYRLPEAKLETVSFKPKSAGGIASFYSTIVVGDVRCQTYPSESPSEDVAEAMACQMLLETRRYGLWRDSVPAEYRRLFQERVPDNWEDLLYTSGAVRFDCVGADRYILYSASQT
ncbi:predicted GPI-anchored protein 58 [Pollicipes pollicipes]|uniref:predicted GPI-anchored protein 58 n=1 Tax=Pollicipes pollicipes TaxID=41117 RepID=UPI0018859464|nr:predicted GPI-anchored protein 58 [Pollicipes pollicipes]